ncbi:hypothetical protein HDU99_006086, partial [Rhizoclosmatium hyalinum]
MDWALLCGQTESVRILITDGRFVSTTQDIGDVLQDAKDRGHTACVKFMLEYLKEKEACRLREVVKRGGMKALVSEMCNRPAYFQLLNPSYSPLKRKNHDNSADVSEAPKKKQNVCVIPIEPKLPASKS